MCTFIAELWAARLLKKDLSFAHLATYPSVAQAGLTLGLAVLITDKLPTYGPPFAVLIIAVAAVNEVIGPVMFKFALTRSGESGAQDRETEV